MDWIATLFGLTGCYFVSKGKRWGWLLFAIASSINIYIGLREEILGMALGCMFYLMIELKCWWTHNKDKK